MEGAFRTQKNHYGLNKIYVRIEKKRVALDLFRNLYCKCGSCIKTVSGRKTKETKQIV